MKSQNTQYPVVSKYDDKHIAVPMNIKEITKQDDITGEISTAYEYDLVLIEATDAAITKKLMVDVIQAYMDKEANTHEYDTIGSLCNYTTSIAFGDEARNGVIFRDACWLKGIEILNACEAGTRPIPTVEELLAEMPVMEWP